MIYTVTFNPAIDYVVHTDAMTVGDVNRSSGEEIYFGGKGINVSMVLKELDVPSRALGFLAGFTGTAIEQGLQADGIDTDFVHLDAGFTRINVKIKAGTETELNGRGPEIPAEKLEELFQKLNALQDGDTLILAGSIPSTLPSDSYEQILKRLSGRNIRFVVDATRDLLKNVLKYKPFLIKPNHLELGEMFGTQLRTTDEIIAHAEKLQQMGARNVLVSMAGDGAILLDETVGAGDSMVAGFVAGCETGDYAHALRLGTAAGGATAFSEGLAKRPLIDSLLRQLGETQQ